MARFRKKPVEVEAFRWSVDATPAWFKEALSEGKVDLRGMRAVIETLEGKMHADQGDWVIRGLQGELYPCKPNIFQQTYEAVE